jgi:hypothetical protein
LQLASHADSQWYKLLCREKNLEKTIKEARLKARKETNRKEERLDLACDEDLNKLEEEFYSTTGAQRSTVPAVGTDAGG